MILLVVSFFVFTIIPFTNKSFLLKNNVQASTFTNTHFNTDISATNKAEDFVSYNELHAIITNKINEDESDENIKSALINKVNNRRVAIYTADDLYHFSVNSSFNRGIAQAVNPTPYIETIKYLLNLDYVLLNNIDYSSMRSKHFLPIGIYAKIPDKEPPTIHPYPFTGSFDGQGYTISNLYLANRDYITVVYRFNNDPLLDEEIPLASYYSMFAHVGETAKISNFILKNPIWELPNAPEGLIQTSILLGENKGLVYNVGVIDERKNASGDDISGIRFNIQYGSSTKIDYTAAGFVHTNYGKIFNSYYISMNVMATSSRSRFLISPFVYENKSTGKIDGASYHNMVEDNVNFLDQPIGVKSYNTLDLKTGKKDDLPINLNSVNLSEIIYRSAPLVEKRKWYFYEDDGYPSFDGLEYNGSYFLIDDEYDLVIFSSLIQKKTTHENGHKYNKQTYVLTDNIDMKNIISYHTPGVLFEGILSGGEGDLTDGNQNKYILNLNKITPFITTTEYQYGLIGKLSGTISNINFYNCNSILDVLDLHTKIGYIGMAVGVLQGGTIKNIISNASLNFGIIPLGKTYGGGLVGYGTGDIEKVANTGLINGGIHEYNNQIINPEFYLGGIIGASGAENLVINNVINKGDITGFSSTGTYNLMENVSAQIKIGGIIGQVNNQTSIGHSLYYITNKGTITAGQFLGREGVIVKQQVGGIFGNVTGNANRITTDNKTFINGRYENDGLIKGSFNNIYRIDYLAGIGHASTTTPKAEFSYMINKKGLDYTGFNVGTHNQYVYYASTIMDHSITGIKLSRAYNEYNYVYGESYFTNSASLTFDRILIAPFFASINDASSDLVYVHNKGSIQVGETDNILDATKEMRIAGITLASKVNYQNVTVSGNIDVLKINNSSSIYVAGLAWILSYNKLTMTPYQAINSLFEGSIRTANILGNTTIDTETTSESAAATNFNSYLTIANLYVAGLFNINVGSIKNSFNRGELTSNYNNEDLSFSDIDGTANIYVGGLVTFNYYIIEDCGNTGNIHYINSNTNSKTMVSGGDDPPYDYAKYGGLVYAFKGGITLGGLVAAFGDVAALVLKDGTVDYGQNAEEVIDNEAVKLIARILNSSNAGDVFGKAKEYVRSGGILGVALGSELTSGTFNNDNNSNEDNPLYATFSTCVFGKGDKIARSKLYNGLNFGNITSITSKIGIYTGNIDNLNENAASANSKRPGIYACAGGVIGYGLCEMKRMLNHGIICSTDVAGGIVGATYILGGTGSGTGIAVTLVKIDTAVHYGKVNAINYQDYSSINFDSELNWYNHDNYYYDNESDFIFPYNNGYNLSVYPNKKRGFGGIFGRLQRGAYGAMQSEQFINILNMDSSVDMIGRADQSSYRSLIYYRFSVNGQPDTYYTARPNDTTPATVVGYISRFSTNQTLSKYDATYTINKSGSTYYLDRMEIANGSGTYTGNATRTVAYYNETDPGASASTQTISYNNRPFSYFSMVAVSSRIKITSTNCTSYGLSWSDVTNATYINNSANFSKTDNTMSYTVPYTGPYQYEIKRVTDDDNPSTGIFHSSFPLMNESQSDYIYKANNDVLANRFRLEKVIVDGQEKDNPYYRENGMYVLATEQGRKNGAVLPLNININKFFKLNEEYEEYIDFDNVPYDLLLSSSNDNPIITEFQSMFQTRLNDKSYILPQSGNSALADIVLYDPSGNSPTLSGGTIDNINHLITFTVSKDAFTSTNVTYQVLSATLSEKAVIAVSGITEANHLGFRTAYDERESNILDGDYKCEISMTLTTGLNEFPQKITVYSEIATQVAGLVENTEYKTDYTIVIDYVNTALGITFSNITMNGGTPFTPPTPQNNIYTITNPVLTPNGTIKLTFLDSISNFLPLGHQLTFVGFYYQGTITEEVPQDYYTVINQGKDLNRYFSLSLTLSDELKGGTYLIRYRYYNNTTEYTLVFTKGTSDASFVTSVNYNTFSVDELGYQFDFPFQNTNFKTYLGFGIELVGISYDLEQSLNIETLYKDVKSFVNEVNYYQIKSGNTNIIKITLSPFAKLLSVKASYDFDLTSKLKNYTIKYEIENEAETIETIVHTITERSLPDLIVYNNGNHDFNRPVGISRENFETMLELDFGFLNPIYNLNISTIVKKENISYDIIHSEIELINNHDFYQIIIKHALESGIKEFIFTLDRGNGILMTLGNLFVEKLEGTSAYLWDINFQIGSSERLIYPFIYEANSDGTIKIDSNYDMRLYYDGIDYAKADINKIRHFRIDGLVSDIDLEAYCPEFSLPAGAKIYRKDSGGNWTDDLYGNFLSEDENLAIVEYKVVPEDESEENIVYYYITAEDLDYNLTIRFTLYYQFKDGTIVKASDSNSPINNRVILIVVRNFALKENDDNNEPIEYQTVDENGHLIYPYEGKIVNYIVGMNNQSTMFYFPTIYQRYIYTFARNLSGCYGFTIVTPLYSGPTEYDLVKGERYSYDIYLSYGLTPSEEDPYPWYGNDRLLPDLDETGIRTGKYFFIEGSTDKNRIRDFAIVINEATVGSSWGLYDDQTSWDQAHN